MQREIHGTTFKVASGFWLWLLNRLSADAWTSNWNTVYIRAAFFDTSHPAHERLVRHELAHIRQIQRDGRLWQPIKYTWYWIRRGYWDNPYEIEARAAEGVPIDQRNDQ